MKPSKSVRLADYQAQADRPFDHEARMKDLLLRQEQLNAALVVVSPATSIQSL